MSRNGKINVLIAGICFVFGEMAVAHRSSGTVLLAILSLLFFLGVTIHSLVCVLTEWRQYRWLAAIPLATCVLVILVFKPVGQLARKAIFAWSLPSYEAVVHDIESGSIPVSTVFKPIPQAIGRARLAYGVFAQRDEKGVLLVEFFTESGFPALHSGYLYNSSGSPGAGVELRWPTIIAVRSNWFYFSN